MTSAYFPCVHPTLRKRYLTPIGKGFQYYESLLSSFDCAQDCLYLPPQYTLASSSFQRAFKKLASKSLLRDRSHKRFTSTPKHLPHCTGKEPELLKSTHYWKSADKTYFTGTNVNDSDGNAWTDHTETVFLKDNAMTKFFWCGEKLIDSLTSTLGLANSRILLDSYTDPL